MTGTLPRGMVLYCDGEPFGITDCAAPLQQQKYVIGLDGQRRNIGSNTLVVGGTYHVPSRRNECTACMWLGQSISFHCVRFDPCEENVAARNREDGRTFTPRRPCNFTDETAGAAP